MHIVIYRITGCNCPEIGEANVGNPTYACKFAKMIEAWRQTWNERTNTITDIHFPFGFVQISIILFIFIDR